MKRIFLILISIPVLFSCKKELDVKNPNNPTPSSANTEQGIISLAQGGIYVNGFVNLKFTDGVYGAFWSGAMGFHELMGDVVGAEAANAYLNQIGTPYSVTLDNGTVVLNPSSPARQKDLIRQINTNANQGENTLYYEWGYMYNMISACNTLLDLVDQVEFIQDADAKKAAIKAWAYWWKGYAYSRIGSTYYAGIINNTAAATNGNYVTQEAIIAEANAQLDLSATTLSAITADQVQAFTALIGKIIPDYFQVGLGGVPTPGMWIHSINTLKARNILVNKLAGKQTSSDWQAVLDLVNKGLEENDHVFTLRTNEAGDLISATGTVAGKTQSTAAGGNTYKLSERWVQEFNTLHDLRYKNNIAATTTWIGNSDRGNIFNTKHTLVDGGNGINRVVVYANSAPGAYELYLATTWQENELMKAEALIHLGNINDGLKAIDAVRVNQGAGLPSLANTGLTADEALEELRKERRITLAFRGLSFYDARRWGVIFPVSEGGGRRNAWVVDNTGKFNTRAIIEYDYLDYWDVPDTELAYNPPADGSAAIKNPK